MGFGQIEYSWSFFCHFTMKLCQCITNQVEFLWGGHHQDFTNSVSTPSHKCMWYSLPLFEALLSWTERVLAISLQFGKSTTRGSTCESLYKLSMQNWQEVILNLPNEAQQAMPMPDWYQQPHGHFPPSLHILPSLLTPTLPLLSTCFCFSHFIRLAYFFISKQKQWKQIYSRHNLMQQVDNPSKR